MAREKIKLAAKMPNYITDKQLKQTIDSLVGDTLITAAAEDVTERVLHEALLKTAKGGSHTKRFIMTSKKLPATNSDDEIHTDNEALAVPQGDTPLSPEVLKTVHTLGEENVMCTEKESLEEEIKKMISKISSFDFENSSGKVNATEGQGDAEVVESTPSARETICESQGAPNLLLQRSSSEERKFQEITAAWEEAVEVEVQVMDPDYEDENNSINHRENISPYISRTGLSIHSSTGEIAPIALKHPDQTTSDELELEALTIGAGMVIEIMSRVDDVISASESYLNHMEGTIEHPNDIQGKENDKNDKMNKNIAANKQVTIELEKDQTTTLVLETTTPSLTGPENGKKTKEESDEEDLYDIESITICSNEFLMPNAHHTTANSNLQTNSHAVPSSGFQKNGKDLEPKSCEKKRKIDINESMFKHAAEVTVPFSSVQSPRILTGQIMGASAEHLFNSPDIKAIKPMEDKEYFEICNTIVTKSKDHIVNPNYLAATNECVTPEYFKSFTSPTIHHKKMGNKVQSYDDIFVRPNEQPRSTSLHDNEFGRTEMPLTSCVRSFDSLSEVNYKCSEFEETTCQPGQNEKLHNAININIKASHTFRCNDSQESSPATNSEIIEHNPPAPSSGVLKCNNELLDTLDVQKTQPYQRRDGEYHSEALVLPEKKELKFMNASTFDARDTTDVFASINNASISTDATKIEEVLCTRTQSSLNLIEATFCNTQEDNREESYSDFLEATFTSSYENIPIQDIMCNSSNIKEPQISSKPERLVKIENQNIPSSSQDEKGARKKNDIDSNLSRKKLGPGEAPNGKVCKTWKFTNKMKKLISSIKRKN